MLAAAGGALMVAGAIAVCIWSARIHHPPNPPAAQLPASARMLLQPYRKDSFDLTVGAQQEANYRVGMQAGATLVYAWSTGQAGGHGGEPLFCEFAGRETRSASEAHSAFVAQSSGWYHWRWKNQNSRSVTIHLKLSGYYEPATVPPAGMPYDR